MKRVLILLVGIGMALTSTAQTDTTQRKTDTIHIGNMIIIKTPGAAPTPESTREAIRTYERKRKASPVSTNWLVIDIGFTNYSDKTNYAGAEAQAFAPGATEDWFKLRSGKSSTVSIWIFMQRISLIKNYVNLKYGLGVETNNYRYTQPIKYNTNPTQVVMDNSTHYSKNKLAADYVTIPMMLNFNFTPRRKHSYGFSVGASAGYLYSSRQKTITDKDGKQKTHDDFDLDPWKISYVGEVSLGYIKLFGSLATKSMFEKGLDQTPYSFGIRLSNW
ncbi:MAG: outer membrane beta-barrel protein [Chitinophagaceae bacterium]